ncbi:MAG: alkaline phytoceramidase [Methylotenera sp.]|nr:alkaline phytoceramidase [Methylotenera sp.]MDP1595323.1 alkaline phytoceramidase [Methylotenera sp.]MDP1755211.1 alkaline phytoceramidase [Methylotenera sp.]MDP1959483.1 alkaline phytoceramidase [Methylotenera sp.]MDP2403880.1 alkaline phytoceramidase [Methylotenera sp.]
MNYWRNTSQRAKALSLWLLVAVLALAASMLPRIAQPLWYHYFADQRACFSLPNCLDTASNALFVMAGAAGLIFLHNTHRSTSVRRTFIDPREARPYALFFFATILVGISSGFYHLSPDNDRLMWDRAAIALALMAWFAAILCERVSLSAGLRLLPLLVIAGLISAYYWGWSEVQGLGDLRPYGLTQITAVLLIPLLLWLYPPRYSGDRDILMVIVLYSLALLFDLSDRQVFALTGGIISGHTVKHVIAALAAYWVMRYLQRRRVL